MNSSSFVPRYVLSGFFAALAFVPLGAHGLYKKVLPWTCLPRSTDNSKLVFTTAGLGQETAHNNELPDAICPYPSDPDLPHSSVSSIDVHVVDMTTGTFSIFVVKACVLRNSPTGGAACGTTAGNGSAAGEYNISVSPSAWTSGLIASTNGFPYVNVQYPASPTPLSTLQGIKVQ